MFIRGLSEPAIGGWPNNERGNRSPHPAHAIGHFVIRRYRLCVFLVLCLTAFNFFWHLSTSAIYDMDEARYGVSSNEMLQRHSLLVATYAGRPEFWNLKPPLGYWMQELSFRAFGPTVFAMRLPAALCALVAVALTILIAGRWYGRQLGLLAGLILTTCFGFVSNHGARSGDLDAALTLIMLIAVVQVPGLTTSSSRRLLWASMLALGFLLKSFAIAPFLGVTVVYLIWSGDWRSIRWREWMPAFSLLVLIVLAWVIARSWVDHSTHFVHRMVREDLFGRSMQNIDTGSAGYLNYSFALFDRFAPWPVLIIATLLWGQRTEAQPLAPHSRLIICWALVPLAAFSLAHTQHHWYLDPSYPAWSILAADATLGLLSVCDTRRSRQSIMAFVCVCLLLCEARVVMRIGVTDRRPEKQEFLLSLRDSTQVPSGQTISVGFSLSNSERFIIEVIDGYKIDELTAPVDLAASTTHRVILLHRTQAAEALAHIPHVRLISESSDYALLTDGSSSTASPKASRSPDDWEHLHGPIA